MNRYPYTDMHEMNLDWILLKVKEMIAEWDTTKNAWNELHEFVDTYFENLDVQQEINNKLDEMAEGGELLDLMKPYVDEKLPLAVADQIADVVALQIGAVVAAQLPDVVSAQLPDIAATAAAAEVSDWLTAHVDPDTGYVIDDTLTVAGAAADAKAAGYLGGEIRNEISAANDARGYANSLFSMTITGANLYTNSGSHLMIPIKSGDEIVIKANSSFTSVYAVLTKFEYATAGESPSFSSASGFDERGTVSAGAEATITAPSDAKYLYVTAYYSSNNYVPYSVKINGIDVLGGLRNIALTILPPMTSSTNIDTMTDFGSAAKGAGVIPAGTLPSMFDTDNMWAFINCGGYAGSGVFVRNWQFAIEFASGSMAFRAIIDGSWTDWTECNISKLNELLESTFRNTPIFDYKTEESESTLENKGTTVNVMSYNIGRYNMGESTSGLESSIFADKVTNIKKLLMRSEADLIGAQEDVTTCDREQTKNAHNFIFKPLYPFRVSLGGASCYSKMIPTDSGTRSLQGVDDTRYMSWEKVTIDGKTLLFVSLHASYDTLANRAAEWGDLFNWLSNQTYEWCIIAGDCNLLTNDDRDESNSGSLIKIAHDNNFTLANGDYIGWLYTTPTASLDEIMVSEKCIINKIEVYNDLYDSLYSDHYPIVASVTLT